VKNRGRNPSCLLHGLSDGITGFLSILSLLSKNGDSYIIKLPNLKSLTSLIIMVNLRWTPRNDKRLSKGLNRE